MCSIQVMLVCTIHKYVYTYIPCMYQMYICLYAKSVQCSLKSMYVCMHVQYVVVSCLFYFMEIFNIKAVYVG